MVCIVMEGKSNKCERTICNESGIKCAGVCGKNFHNTKKLSVSIYSPNVLNENCMLQLICKGCVQYIVTYLIN